MEGFENQDGYQNQTDYYSYGQTKDTVTMDASGEKDPKDGSYRPYEEPEKKKRQSRKAK